MRFLFVNKIDSIKGNEIFGSRTFGNDYVMQYEGPNGTQQIPPGLISEGVGQLVSWLAIERNNFTGRPVFLFADHIEIHAPVLPGSKVDMRGEIKEMDGETLVFSGEAHVDGKLVHKIQSSSGYFMPLQDMEDPNVTKQRFADLTGAGMQLIDDCAAYDWSSLAGTVAHQEEGKSIVISKTMSPKEPFYADHFPRFPVTPIVMINEMIGQATNKMIGPSAKSLMAKRVSDVKIKNFLKPDESCKISVKLIERGIIEGKDTIQTIAEIEKEGRKILRGRYIYEIGG